MRGRSVGFSLFNGLKELGSFLTEGKNFFQGWVGRNTWTSALQRCPKTLGQTSVLMNYESKGKGGEESMLCHCAIFIRGFLIVGHQSLQDYSCLQRL